MGDTLSYEEYVNIMRSRVNQAEKLRKKRWKEAGSLAFRLAKFIYANYAVDAVYVFGSILDKNSFRLDSDIDIAVSGLDNTLLGELRERLLKLGSPYKVDLVRLEDYNEFFQKTVVGESELVAR
ncbi:MAG: nucleotidyltransferase domain-containing protein [Peptococcaceae bacterium]|jgi:predicted nucleotidyltransferase|nr:nucleotidyltransferase domain-containing protein [Peptococcaceae bacterium]